ncbi:copper chaperone CopZ [Tetragenococcus muriaticus]|uniref:Copper chaperone CopZ n=2 Tax=Tetragenococcus muriaticus TaxID=64642 RepID=A0A091C287_9ENTE|nr:copper chaperone CopZ [Tetragenococcus muriaticus]KFN91936.1 transcriptional activator [Tetragenococcus muriaticus 3MR10-3]KFN92673.1 transcriptional activator [Tetragenococcus muriaticus PMC-11-5]GMA47602.1 hypothetical protein GCM10025854_18520 [Tetragenococcus muriaticus]
MKQKFSIEDMNCNHCVTSIEKAINELPGIQKVSIHLKRKNGVVKFDDTQIDSNQIAKKIIDTGYTAKLM